jgi:cytochrome c oxidase cbb3-type subunit 3
MSTMRQTLRIGLFGAGCIFALGCQRETRRFRESPPAATSETAVTMSELQPGPKARDLPVLNPYERNAYGVSEGERLFSAYNCTGCHSHGGGGIGPALMDDQWIYGSDPENIFATIVEGRPNGMPAFRGKIPNNQVWQLVAYVRSLSGLLPKDIAPARDDHMVAGPEPQRTEPLLPKHAFTPPAAEHP